MKTKARGLRIKIFDLAFFVFRAEKLPGTAAGCQVKMNIHLAEIRKVAKSSILARH